MIRSERRVMYEQSRKILTEAGYEPIGRLFLNRYATYRVLSIAVNRLAYLTNRPIARVWQYLIYTHSHLMRGAKFRPAVICQANQEALREWEEQEVPAFCCPRCGCNMLDAGPVTFDEVSASMRERSRMRDCRNDTDEVVEPADNATQSPTMSD